MQSSKLEEIKTAYKNKPTPRQADITTVTTENV